MSETKRIARVIDCADWWTVQLETLIDGEVVSSIVLKECDDQNECSEVAQSESEKRGGLSIIEYM